MAAVDRLWSLWARAVWEVWAAGWGASVCGSSGRPCCRMLSSGPHRRHYWRPPQPLSGHVMALPPPTEHHHFRSPHTPHCPPAIYQRTGTGFNIKTIFYWREFSIIKIRQPSDHLTFIMEIQILVRQHFYIEKYTDCLSTAHTSAYTKGLKTVST